MQSSTRLKARKVGLVKSGLARRIRAISKKKVEDFLVPQVRTPPNAMASVYKSLSKSSSAKAEAPANGIKKNKQRVLILSSRGITYRLVSKRAMVQWEREGWGIVEWPFLIHAQTSTSS
jgi:hypothetical protein